MRRLLTVLLVFVANWASAQHPRAIYDSTITTRVQTKAGAADADWLAMKGSASGPAFSCDYVTRTTAGTGDSLPPVYAPREPVTLNPAGTVHSGYQGEDFARTLGNLGACYRGVLVSNPGLAATYADQAVKILDKMSQPFPTVTPASAPASWGTLTVRPAAYVNGDGPGGQARVHLYYHGLSTGATITIAGVTGCTSANITGKVGATSSLYFDLNDSGGAAVTCNGAGTNYGWNFLTDSGYGIRFYGVWLALGYDWFYDELTAGQRAQIIATINAYLDEIKNGYSISGGGWFYDGQTQSNYHTGYVTALALAGICTRGGGENARGQEWYDYWRDTMYEDVDKVFMSRWLDNYAGFDEAVSYQGLSIFGYTLMMLAQYTANAEALWAANEMPWFLENMRYFVHNTMPARTHLTGRGQVATGPIPPNGWGNWHLWGLHHVAAVASDAFAPYFKDYLEDLTTLNSPSQYYLWTKVVFWDSSLSSSDWTTEPLSQGQKSNPAGGYLRTVMRSDWTTSAVFGDLTIGPMTDSGWNGKSQFDKGSLMVLRGDGARLLVSPQQEAGWVNNTPFWNWADSNRYIAHGIYYVTRSGDSAPALPVGPNPGGDAPFIASPVVLTSSNQKIDRYEDQTSYVYSRAVGLSQGYRFTSGGSYPIQGWEREVLYLRPKVFIVYDRTNKVNDAVAHTQKMAWNVGKTPTTSAYGTGLYRTEVEDGATYKGGLTWVLPSGMASPASTNLGGYSLVYQLSNAPPSETQYVNWLTVADAADAQANLAEIALFATRSNVDAIRVGTDTVVGFTSQQHGAAAAFPLTYTMAGMGDGVTHYLCGLAASTTYKRTVSGNDVTIATSGGGTDTLSTAAGCITFASGSAPAPPVVIGTASPMPSGTVGTAYDQTISVTGGDGGPYTCAVDSGAFPTSLTLNSNCTVTGTPTVAETAAASVVATDGSANDSAPKSLSITIAANSPVITTPTIPNGVQSVPYTTTIGLTGGVAPYAFTVQSGALCAGLSLAEATGIISGTPTTVESCSFTIRATDDNAAFDDQAYAIQVVASAYTIAIDPQPGSGSVVVRFGSPGMPYGAPCTVQVRLGDVTVQEAVSASGPSRRVVGFNGLSSDTEFGVIVSCQWLAPDATAFFRTAQSSGGGPQTVRLQFGAPDILPSVARLLVEYGTTEAVSDGSEQDTDGGDGFAVNLTLSAGLYYYRYKWQTAADAVLATSAVQPLVVP